MTDSASVTIPVTFPPVVTADNPNETSYTTKCYIMATLLVAVVGLTILVTWIILRPTDPTFRLQGATLYAFNLTDSNRLLTTSLQVTLSSRNPNRRLGIDYVSMGTYASYRGQRITLPAQLPRSYLGSKEVVDLTSPVLFGESVAFSLEMAAVVAQDLSAGVLPLDLKVYGQLRWKVGTVFTLKYRLDVNCPAYLTSAVAGGIGGMVDGGGRAWYQLANQGCHVDVSP